MASPAWLSSNLTAKSFISLTIPSNGHPKPRMPAVKAPTSQATLTCQTSKPWKLQIKFIVRQYGLLQIQLGVILAWWPLEINHIQFILEIRYYECMTRSFGAVSMGMFRSVDMREPIEIPCPVCALVRVAWKKLLWVHKVSVMHLTSRWFRCPLKQIPFQGVNGMRSIRPLSMRSP